MSDADRIAALEEEIERLRTSTRGAAGSTSQWTAALGDATSGIGKFGLAALSGETRLTAYVDAFTPLMRRIPIVGDALGGMSKAIAGYIDESTASYQGLTRSGILLSGGLTEVGQVAARSGMLVGDFAKLVEKNRDILGAMGGTGADATRMFAHMSNSFRNDTRGFSQGLRRIGYSTEEINETIMGFAAINRTSFLQTMGNDVARNKATQEYALELDRLSQLTGMQRKELQKEMDAKRREGRIQAFLRTETGALTDQISNSITQIGAMDKNAATLLEDILVQGNVTRESAGAAAFYGQEVIAAAQNMRAAMQAQDPEAYAQAQREYIAAMTRAQNDENRIRIGRIRSDSDYIRGMQDSLGNFTNFNDRLIAIRQELANADPSKELADISFDDALAELNRRIEAGQETLGGGGGPPPPSTDGLTAAMASAQDAITNVSGALRENMINVLKNEVDSGLRGFATTLDGINSAGVTGVNAVGTGLVTGGNSVNQPTTLGAATPEGTAAAGAAAGITQEAETNRIPPELHSAFTELNNVLQGLLDNTNPQGNFLGGTALGGMLNMVGERGPEFITPNANSLVVSMKQMADKMRPQMEAMANQMRPQMEAMANQMRPQMESMANQMAPQMQNMANQIGPQMEQFTGELNRKFDRLIEAYRENTRAVNKAGRNTYRV